MEKTNFRPGQFISIQSYRGLGKSRKIKTVYRERKEDVFRTDEVAYFVPKEGWLCFVTDYFGVRVQELSSFMVMVMVMNLRQGLCNKSSGILPNHFRRPVPVWVPLK